MPDNQQPQQHGESGQRQQQGPSANGVAERGDNRQKREFQCCRRCADRTEHPGCLVSTPESLQQGKRQRLSNGRLDGNEGGQRAEEADEVARRHSQEAIVAFASGAATVGAPSILGSDEERIAAAASACDWQRVERRPRDGAGFTHAEGRHMAGTGWYQGESQQQESRQHRHKAICWRTAFLPAPPRAVTYKSMH